MLIRRFFSQILFLTALLVSGCASYEPLDVTVINLQPLAGTLLEQRVRVDLRLLNPSDQALEVSGLRFKLDVNGKRLAQGVSDAVYEIPRLSDVTTSVVASTTAFGWIRQLMGLEGRETLTYRLSGKVYVKNGLRNSIRFKKEGEINLSAQRRGLAQ